MHACMQRNSSHAGVLPSLRNHLETKSDCAAQQAAGVQEARLIRAVSTQVKRHAALAVHEFRTLLLQLFTSTAYYKVDASGKMYCCVRLQSLVTDCIKKTRAA